MTTFTTSQSETFQVDERFLPNYSKYQGNGVTFRYIESQQQTASVKGDYWNQEFGGNVNFFEISLPTGEVIRFSDADVQFCSDSMTIFVPVDKFPTNDDYNNETIWFDVKK